MSEHNHSSHTETYQMESARWSAGRNAFAFVALAGILGSAAAYFISPARFFQSYLVAFGFTTAIGIAALFFVMVQYLTGSAWSVTMRRIMENIMSSLPAGAILVIPILIGAHYIYPWTDAKLVQSNEALRWKSVFLNEGLLPYRTYAYFLLWSIWVFAIYRQSTKQDTAKSEQQMYAISRWAAPGLFLAVVVGSIASFDWLMSIEPTWYSTIFGLYYLAGGSLAFMSVVVVTCLSFRRAGLLTNAITEEHYHDLGKWLFALTAFYTYIGFSQYLLTWYSNMPEETIFYRHRIQGSWLPWSLALPFLRFFFPFFTLLCRPAKRKLGLIGFLAVYSLIMEYLDLYWVVMPVHFKDGPQFSWIDLATLATTVGVAGSVFWSKFKNHKMVPVGDLRLQQALHFENA